MLQYPRLILVSSAVITRLEMSAPAHSINRTTTIHWCSAPNSNARGTDTGGHHSSSDGPRYQPDAGPYDATSRITNILAIDHGTGGLTAHGQPGDQERRQRD